MHVLEITFSKQTAENGSKINSFHHWQTTMWSFHLHVIFTGKSSFHSKTGFFFFFLKKLPVHLNTMAYNWSKFNNSTWYYTDKKNPNNIEMRQCSQKDGDENIMDFSFDICIKDDEVTYFMVK